MICSAVAHSRLASALAGALGWNALRITRATLVSTAGAERSNAKLRCTGVYRPLRQSLSSAAPR